jgi:hypothetical protein
MAALPDNLKVFIIQHLAMFCQPSEVAEAVKREFGKEVSRQTIWTYVPEHNSQLAKKWVALFNQVRVAFIENLSEIPMSHQAYRLKELQKMFDREKAQPRKNPVMMMKILEQGAKEIGGFMTNRRELTGKDGKPLAAIDPAELARELYQELTSKDGWKHEEAIQFVADRYQVDQAKIVSEANN